MRSRLTSIPRCSVSASLIQCWVLCASSAIADKEAVEAREIQEALKAAFDEIDDDGGCATARSLPAAASRS